MKVATKVLVGVTIAAWATLFVWGVFLYFDLTLEKSKWKPTYDTGDEIERPSGEGYVLHEYSGENFFVIKSETWAMTQAAKACYLAKQEHQLLVIKYQESTNPPQNLHGIPDTLDTIVWAQKTDARDLEYRGKKTYLFVEPSDLDRNVVVDRLAQALDQQSSELLKGQLINLRDNKY